MLSPVSIRAHLVGTVAEMNWNDKNSSDVSKERIWKEYCIAESKELRVFDNYREPKNLRSVSSPVSIRSPDFLDRTSVLMRSVCSTVLPQVRQRTVQRLMHPSGGESRLSGENNASFGSSNSAMSPTSDWSPSPHLSLRQRPTSSQEIGSCLAPLVPKNTHHFHYGIKKLQLTPAYVVH